MHKNITKEDFVSYLQNNKLSETGKKFMIAHYSSPGHAATMGELAHSVGYESFSTSNALYGRLAGKAADYFTKMGVLDQSFRNQYVNITLFTKHFAPATKNRHAVLYMKDELASALEECGFVTKGMKSQTKLIKTDPEDPDSFEEGDEKFRVVKQYERSTEARRKCIAVNGNACAVCNLSFGDTYGEEFIGLIVVHHLKPLALKERRETDPANDMKPLCPNCHAMAHYRLPANTPRTIETLKKILDK